MHNQIWNPNTQNFISLFSSQGRALLKTYIKQYMNANQMGGAIDQEK